MMSYYNTAQNIQKLFLKSKTFFKQKKVHSKLYIKINSGTY